MTRLVKKLVRRARQNKAQALVEYTLLLSLITLAAIGTLRGIGQGVAAKLTIVKQALD